MFESRRDTLVQGEADRRLKEGLKMLSGISFSLMLHSQARSQGVRACCCQEPGAATCARLTHTCWLHESKGGQSGSIIFHGDDSSVSRSSVQSSSSIRFYGQLSTKPVTSV